MNILKNILVGILIGVANIIPGVSGGTMALSLGVYEDIIYSINHLFKEFKKSMKILIPLGIGIVLAVLLLSKLIAVCFENFPINTTSVFVGLIIGALPMLFNKVKGEKINITNIICFLVGFALICSMAFLGEGSESTTFPTTNLIVILLIGVIASATMIIPGVSGSMILALLGFYLPIINTINVFIEKMLKFDIFNAWNEIFILTFFGLGVIIGVIVLARIIELMFNKFKIPTFYVIIGIIVASPIVLLGNLNFVGIGFLDVVFMLISMAIGFVVSIFLGEKN